MKQPTNAQVRKALHGSINKWKKIAVGELIDRGIDNCPLCQMFWGDDCKGCPVEVDTKAVGCRRTPYDDWIIEGGGVSSLANTRFLQTVALKEVAYLESLDRKYFVEGV